MKISLADALRICPEVVVLEQTRAAQAERIAQLEARIQWLERQYFGAMSERRAVEAVNLGHQLWLGMELMPVPADPPPKGTTVKEHERRQRRKPTEVAEPGSQLRFGPNVPVQEIIIENPEAKDIPEEERELVGEDVVCRLGQRSPYIVLRYIKRTYKRRDNGVWLKPPTPPSVIDGSSADVSFLAGLIVDKFHHHLPLYRQHQRLEQSDVYLSRGTLTRLVHRSFELLEPIYTSLVSSVLQSPILAVDESPTPAIRKKGTNKQPGQMKNGYFWAFYGSRDEVFFLYAPTRSQKVLDVTLEKYQGILLTDGYIVYESFALGQGILHAQCWSHSRRNFIYAEKLAEKQCKEVLLIFQQLYGVERKAELGSEELRELRDKKSRPIVEALFKYLERIIGESIFLPSNAFLKAVQYMLDRREALCVFLDDPRVPLDTNHVERTIRPTVVGRNNWLFNWTETGARYSAMAYSLIQSCVAANVNPTTYFTDVLQRIQTHLASETHLLTPRLWAQHFAKSPMKSLARP